ncbi:MAG: recombinase family protein [Clostridiales bacterium]|nr:recombinase family protein [Clostridiales bacterium]
MKVFGYHRTSTAEQHLDRGIKEITEYCEKNNLELRRIYTDQQSGKNFNRERYIVMKEDVLDKGDTLIITELDRLGRNKKETLNELRYFKDRDIRVMILELPTTLMDLSALEDSMAAMLMDAVNNMLIELYAAMAQAELEKKEKRQREGIEAKKARGEWDDYGRPHAIDFEKFANEYLRVIRGEIRPVDCMRILGLKKSTYYNYVKRWKEQNKKESE